MAKPCMQGCLSSNPPCAVAAVSASRSALPSPLPLPEPGRPTSADPERARTPAHRGSCCAPGNGSREDCLENHSMTKQRSVRQGGRLCCAKVFNPHPAADRCGSRMQGAVESIEVQPGAQPSADARLGSQSRAAPHSSKAARSTLVPKVLLRLPRSRLPLGCGEGASAPLPAPLASASAPPPSIRPPILSSTCMDGRTADGTRAHVGAVRLCRSSTMRGQAGVHPLVALQRRLLDWAQHPGAVHARWNTRLGLDTCVRQLSSCRPQSPVQAVV